MLVLIPFFEQSTIVSVNSVYTSVPPASPVTRIRKSPTLAVSALLEAALVIPRLLPRTANRDVLYDCCGVIVTEYFISSQIKEPPDAIMNGST